MGNRERRDRRSGRLKSGRPERMIEKRRRRNRERQEKHRSQKLGRTLAGSALGAHSLVDNVPAREIRRGARQILNSIEETLQDFPTPAARCRVLQRVLACSISSGDILASSLPLSMENHAERDIVSGLQKSLGEVKLAKTAAHLATKHAILTAVVSSGSSTSIRSQARALQIHPRNIAKAVVRRSAMESSSVFKWTLSVRKQRSDVLSDCTKVAVALWWTSETRNSPIAKEVVRQRIDISLYNVKPLQYLMETQVCTNAFLAIIQTEHLSFCLQGVWMLHFAL